ncbi:MAG TPA: ATP-binding cassette domain-containing protein [Burkholderiaceae bacterium]|nr:ATP-binding cassette domain-containing protein [Burkholderiaceae bacterium]
MIAVRNLGVSVGPVSILENVSFEAAAGSVVGIVGHNGAGKTTLMRAIVGVLPPVRGQVLFEGVDVTHAPTQQRVRWGMGYMPEDRRLVPDLSVRANILLPMELNGVADRNRRLDQVLTLIPELVPLIDRRGNQLSGGQQKLAALARAIGYGHRLLLLDEPFEGVAPALVARLTGVLRDLRANGPTVIVTDSEGANLNGLCDVRLRIERGRVELDQETHA